MLIILIYFLLQDQLSAAESNTVCDKNSDTYVNYHVDYGKPIYRSVSNFPEGIRNIDQYHVRGLTDINYKRSYNIKVKLITKNNVACLKIDSVDVYFGYPSINVFIYDKYPIESCEYRVIKQHENEHVKIYQSALKMYSESIGRIILNRIKDKKQMLIEDVDNVKNKTKEYVQEVKDFITSDEELNKIESKMIKEIEYLNNLLDTKENYNKTKKLCNNW